jgi:lipoprotein-anchoring transpeptidase ErfK/SrfK
MNKTFDRRDFLKYSLMLSANALLWNGRPASFYTRIESDEASSGKLGRVLYNGSTTHRAPDESSEVVATYAFNDIVEYEREVKVDTGRPHSEIWFQLKDESYLHSKNAQPVQNRINEPVRTFNTSGQLVEVTVPFTTAVVNRQNNNRNKTENQMFFYGSTHCIYGLGKDEEGTLYYLVKEDRWEDSYYVNASHLRLIDETELTPTSTEMDQSKKVIRIDLREQFLIAYENEEPVFMSALSSGQLIGDIDLTTPAGKYVINYKRPSRHMVHTDRIGSNDDELYGVPWVSYFTESGIAFHGTYWHNDFSKPNSHGCINLPIPAARWIYLWTQPVVAPGEMKHVSNNGTRVEVY